MSPHRARSLARAQLVQKQAITDAQLDIPGGSAGHTVAPVENAGCYAPGGRYPLPSSVIMTVTTARVAGCKNVWAASPRPNSVTLGAAYIAGADALLAAGGAHAIAGLAYGCGSIGPSDCVVGPGNQYVVAAKSMIAGRVAIDMLAGPSECLIIADDSASPAVVAADLLAQAEHDPQALPSLVSTSEELIVEVDKELEKQLSVLPTAEIAREACKNGYAVLVSSAAEAVEISDRLAPEHLEVHMANSSEVASKCQHYGGLFIGHTAAEVLGDYGAGPNHTLPTGGTARSTGGLSVFTFLRVRTWLSLDQPKTAAGLVRDAHTLAKLEGLEGHAVAAALRLDAADREAMLGTAAARSLNGDVPDVAHDTGIASPVVRPVPGSLNDTTGNMLLALPKKGRLAEICMKFVGAAGLQYHRLDRLDVAPCTNLPITLVFLPAKDIAAFVGMGNVDAGITGQDMVAENGCSVQTELELGIGKCSLALQVPEADAGKCAADYAGGRIATSFPNLTRKYFDPLDAVQSAGTRAASARRAARAASAAARVRAPRAGRGSRGRPPTRPAPIARQEDADHRHLGLRRGRRRPGPRGRRRRPRRDRDHDARRRAPRRRRDHEDAGTPRGHLRSAPRPRRARHAGRGLTRSAPPRASARRPCSFRTRTRRTRAWSRRSASALRDTSPRLSIRSCPTTSLARCSPRRC